MFLRNLNVRDKNEKIAGKIKRDLLSTFQQKGINVSKLRIDTNFNRLNVEICIKAE